MPSTGTLTMMATSADYSVVLRDLKARRDVLDAAIKALEPVVPNAGVAGTVNRESPEVKESGKEQN